MRIEISDFLDVDEFYSTIKKNPQDENGYFYQGTPVTKITFDSVNPTSFTFSYRNNKTETTKVCYDVNGSLTFNSPI